MAEEHKTTFIGSPPDEHFSLAERILTGATGAVAILVVCPLMALVWIGLEAERPGPAIDLRATRIGGIKGYRFVLGSGWI